MFREQYESVSSKPKETSKLIIQMNSFKSKMKNMKKRNKLKMKNTQMMNFPALDETLDDDETEESDEEEEVDPTPEPYFFQIRKQISEYENDAEDKAPTLTLNEDENEDEESDEDEDVEEGDSLPTLKTLSSAINMVENTLSSSSSPEEMGQNNQDDQDDQEEEAEDCKQNAAHQCVKDKQKSGKQHSEKYRRRHSSLETYGPDVSGRQNPRDKSQTPKNNPHWHTTTEPMTDIFFDWLDISEAIEAIPNGSSPGPDGSPVKMLKSEKVPILRMLCVLVRRRIDEGFIPENLKQAFVIPVQKGGSKLEPEEYRPISLTSHLMKTGERVIRKYLVGYLESNKKLDRNKHGSRNKISTLS